MKKPLGIKNYGSIPHLPHSRLGPGDYSCNEGQSDILTKTGKSRSGKKFDIIVQEKLDGSNVGIAKVDGIIYPLSRCGYVATTSPYELHHIFAAWVRERWTLFDRVLENGERLVGEWLYQAHGTRYSLPHDYFVPFDLMRGSERLIYAEFMYRIGDLFPTPRILSLGAPYSVERMLKELEPSGHGALDPVEGAVWRAERQGKVQFLAKYVRHEKIDGKYLPEISGEDAVINEIEEP